MHSTTAVSSTTWSRDHFQDLIVALGAFFLHASIDVSLTRYPRAMRTHDWLLLARAILRGDATATGAFHNYGARWDRRTWTLTLIAPKYDAHALPVLHGVLTCPKNLSEHPILMALDCRLHGNALTIAFPALPS